jgi:hypothetical protein
VAATIFEISGVTALPGLDGTSLLADYFTRDPAAPIVAQQRARPEICGYLQQEHNRAWAVRANGLKLIEDAAPVPLLFDLHADPGERTPVTFEQPLAVTALSALPATLGLEVNGAGAPPKAKAPAVDEDLERELRALGYVK